MLTRLWAGRPGIFVLGGGREFSCSSLHPDRLWSPQSHLLNGTSTLLRAVMLLLTSLLEVFVCSSGRGG
jgi:hypothetical protein